MDRPEATARLAELGEQVEYRADLARGRVWWQDRDGRTLLVARCLVISSWARSNGTFLMAWGNASLREAAVLSPVPGVPTSGACSEAECLALAERLADEAGATLCYRAPMPSGPIFLALYDLRAPLAGDDPFAPESPRRWCLRVLRGLRAAIDEGRADEEIAALARGQAGNLLHAARHVYAEGPDAAWLEELADSVHVLTFTRAEDRREAVTALIAEVEEPP